VSTDLQKRYKVGKKNMHYVHLSHILF